jgi:uncharacterized protein YdhG (YjbR/CyaY superfamily)
MAASGPSPFRPTPPETTHRRHRAQAPQELAAAQLRGSDSLHAVPMPKRKNVDDFFAQLEHQQRPHLEALRKLSHRADPKAREELKWNLPVYVRGENTNLWTLQNFKRHCSLRFSPEFFASQKAEVEAAGYEAGAGFIKLPYEKELPTKLLVALMKARSHEYEASEAG